MKKITALLLCLAMLLPMASCAADEKETTADTSADVTVETETEPEETDYTADIPAGTDYAGATFTVLTYPLEGDLVWNDTDWTATELTGEAINDAVYQRIADVEELLNVDITDAQSTGSGDTSTLTKSVQSGDNAYQMANLAMKNTFAVMQQGFLAELNTYAAEGSLDLDAPWWDGNILSDLSIDGKNFCILGDIGTMYKKSIGVIMFNKKIQIDYNLPDFYELMAEGNWTIDTMVEAGVQVSDDLDGDGKMTAEDRFGLICFCDMIALAMIGCDVDFFTKNDADIPSMSFYGERSVAVMEKLAELMYNPNLSYSWSKEGVGEAPAFEMYQEDKSLFYYGELHAVATMRTMESNFGIMPMPKFNQAQESYHHCVNPNVAATYVIPKSNVDAVMTGHVMDALGAASKNLLTPAYYDITLRGKVSRDEESAASLDIVISTIKYDLGYLGDWGINSVLYSMANAYNTDLASKIQGVEKTVATKVEKMVTAVEGLEN
ncbi:MAG: hypothetical protein IKY52_02405 [Clostridia bacterium]|nr:hypothetical protein [Clostridia bacterium]